MKRLRDWYDHPEYYEAIFGTDTVKEMDFLAGGERALRHRRPRCGWSPRAARGGWSRRGPRAGAASWWATTSPSAMLAHARKRLAPAPSAARVRLVAVAHGGRSAPRRWRARWTWPSTSSPPSATWTARRRALAHLQRHARGCSSPEASTCSASTSRTTRATARSASAGWGRWAARTVVCNTREGLPDRRRRRSPMRNRLRVTRAPGRTCSSRRTWYFRTYDAAQARRLFRGAGLRVAGHLRLRLPAGRAPAARQPPARPRLRAARPLADAGPGSARPPAQGRQGRGPARRPPPPSLGSCVEVSPCSSSSAKRKPRT